MAVRTGLLGKLDFRFATAEDVPAMRHLLKRADLPHDDFETHLAHFLTAREGDKLAGMVGLEIAGRFALLRSLVVPGAFGGLGLGKGLCRLILEHGRTMGLNGVYLLTTTVPDFFKKLGFETVEREDAPAEIRATAEFSSLCPASAICMRFPLSSWNRLRG